jgi:hypothetical protein
LQYDAINVNRKFFLEEIMTAKEHNRLLGIFLMAHGALQALTMFIIAVSYGGIGFFLITSSREADRVTGAVFIGLVLFIAVLAVFFVTPQLSGGWRILKEKPGARTWGIVGSIIALLSFPLGTAAGIYGLWFLFGEQGKQFYLSGGAGPVNNFQPPPHNWR